MKNLLCALAGAFAIGVTALPAQAAPLAPAVFHPDETAATVQTVQYRSHFRPRHYDRRAFRHYRSHRNHGPVYHRGAPFRRY